MSGEHRYSTAIDIKKRAITHQIQMPYSLRCIGQIHNSVIRKIGAICQTQLGQPGKLMLSPSLEAMIGDGGTARQINLLESPSRKMANMCHGSISNMLAI